MRGCIKLNLPIYFFIGMLVGIYSSFLIAPPFIFLSSGVAAYGVPNVAGGGLECLTSIGILVVLHCGGGLSL